MMQLPEKQSEENIREELLSKTDVLIERSRLVDNEKVRQDREESLRRTRLGIINAVSHTQLQLHAGALKLLEEKLPELSE